MFLLARAWNFRKRLFLITYVFTSFSHEIKKQNTDNFKRKRNACTRWFVFWPGRMLVSFILTAGIKLSLEDTGKRLPQRVGLHRCNNFPHTGHFWKFIIISPIRRHKFNRPTTLLSNIAFPDAHCMENASIKRQSILKENSTTM